MMFCDLLAKRKCSLYKLIILIFPISVFVVGCGGVKDSAPISYTKKWHEIPDAVPVAVAKSKYGNPESYSVFGKTYYVKEPIGEFKQDGIASWYGMKFHGERASSGEDYDMYAMTAAHKTLPIPVFVEVVNIDNGRKAIVKVNDRGPFHEGRIIDLSYAAATKLGVAKTGTANVSIRVVQSNQEIKRIQSEVIVESPTTENGKIYLQIAAFTEQENAKKYLSKLEGEGFFDVRLHAESKSGSALYKVRLGPLPTEKVAKNILNQLEEKKYRNLKIIKR